MNFLTVEVANQSLVEGLDLVESANILNQLLRIFCPRSGVVVDDVDLIKLFFDVEADGAVRFHGLEDIGVLVDALLGQFSVSLLDFFLFTAVFAGEADAHVRD